MGDDHACAARRLSHPSLRSGWGTRHLFPKRNQFFGMFGGHAQHSSHVASHSPGESRPRVLGVTRSLVAQIHNDFDARQECMDVARRVVLQIGDKSCAGESASKSRAIIT